MDSTCSLFVDSLDSPTCSEVDTPKSSECTEAGENADANLGGAITGTLLGGIVLGCILATAAQSGVYCLLKRARVKREKQVKCAAMNTPNKCRYTKPTSTKVDVTTDYEPIDWNVEVTTTNESESGRSPELKTEAPYAETQFASKPSNGGYANLPIQAGKEPQPASVCQTDFPPPQASGTATRHKNTRPSPATTLEEIDDDGYEDPRLFVQLPNPKPNTCPSLAPTHGLRTPQLNPLPRPAGKSSFGAVGKLTEAEANATTAKPTSSQPQPSVCAQKSAPVASAAAVAHKQPLLPPFSVMSSDRQDREELRSGNRKQVKWKLPMATGAPLLTDRKQHHEVSTVSGVPAVSTVIEPAPTAVLPCDHHGQKSDKKM